MKNKLTLQNTKKNYFKLLVLVCLSLTFAGCPKLDAPPKKVLPTSVPQVGTSVISVPLTTRVSDVRNIIWSEISKVRVNQNDGRLQIRNGYFSMLNLSMNGNNITVETRFKARVKYRYAKIFGKKLYITCGIDGTVKANGTVNVGNNVDVLLNVNSSGNRLRLHKVCNKLLAKAANVIKRFFRNRISKIIAKAANDAIRKNKAKLTFKNQVIASVNKFSKPLRLADNVWLTPNAEKIVYTNLSAQRGYLKFNVAAYAKPQLKYSSTKPSYRPVVFNSVQRVSRITPRTTAIADLRFPYKEAEKLVTPLLSKYANDKFKWLLYKPGKVSFYPSGNKLVVSLQILRKINNSELITLYLTGVPAYNKAKDEIYINNLDFTVDSKSALLKFVTAAAKEGIVKKIKEVARFSVKGQKSKIDNVIKNFSKTVNVLNNRDRLLIQGRFNKVDVTNVFVANEEVGAFAKTTGQINVSYAYSSRVSSRAAEIEDEPVTQTLPEVNCLDCNNDYYNGEIEFDLDSGEVIDYTGDVPQIDNDVFGEDETSISVYPNPTSDFLNIQSSKEVKEVSIYNRLGILTGRYTNLTKIDMSQYPKGVYVIQIVNNDNSQETQSIIKN